MNSILVFDVDLAFAFTFLFLLLLCILFTNCNRIPLFDLAAIAIAIAIALKRLCEVMRGILVWCMFNFIELDFGFNRFCLTLIGCILFPALMFALARSHQCFLKVMVVTVVIVMMKE